MEAYGRSSIPSLWFLSCRTHKKINCLQPNTSTEKNMLWKKDLDSNVENLKEWFRKRGYPEQLIKNQVARAFQSTSNSSANNNKQEKETGIPLVTTYHPRLKDLSSLIKKNLQYLYADQKVENVFTPAPFVSFRSVRNFKSFLVRSKVYPLDRKVGSEKCNGERCLVCLKSDSHLPKKIGLFA